MPLKFSSKIFLSLASLFISLRFLDLTVTSRTKMRHSSFFSLVVTTDLLFFAETSLSELHPQNCVFCNLHIDDILNENKECNKLKFSKCIS